MSVPTSPHEFFTLFAVRRFEAEKSLVAGKSSNGAMTFRVLGVGAWSYRLSEGALQVHEGVASDVIVQVCVTEAAFTGLFIKSAELDEVSPRRASPLLAFNALTIDAEHADLVRRLKGNIAFVVVDGEEKHRVVITPGGDAPDMEHPECQIECTMGDFMDVQLGIQPPLALAMSGRIRIVGNAALALALAGMFA